MTDAMFEKEHAYWSRIMKEVDDRDKEVFELQCDVLGFNLTEGSQVQRLLELEKTNERDDETKRQYREWKISWRERGIKI